MTDPIPRLHLISDRTLCPLERFPEVARRAALAGAGAVHLREKDLHGGPLVEAARRLRRVLPGETVLLVNERVDIALVVGAHGVQLGEDGLSPLDVRAICGRQMLIGRSVHDPVGAERAVVEGADFVMAGHVYDTRSKPNQPARGPAFIEAIARVCPLPVIAVGGITPERVSEVIRAGAYGVAVISGILGATDPEDAARAYAEALRDAETGDDGD